MSQFAAQWANFVVCCAESKGYWASVFICVVEASTSSNYCCHNDVTMNLYCAGNYLKHLYALMVT